jgi:acetyltransferase-like isoleucine patch superfamily enzyme
MLEELNKIFESVIRNIDGSFGRRLRAFHYRRRLGACGKNVIIDAGVYFQNPKHIFIQDNVWIDRYAILIAGPFTASSRKFQAKQNEYYKGDTGNLSISSGVHIAPQSLIQAHGGVHIGKNVTIAAGAKIYSLSHHYRNTADAGDTKRYAFSTMAPSHDQFLILSPVVIEDGAAVGLNSVVLPGTTIRNGTWLGVLTYIEPSVTETNTLYTTAKAIKKL